MGNCTLEDPSDIAILEKGDKIILQTSKDSMPLELTLCGRKCGGSERMFAGQEENSENIILYSFDRTRIDVDECGCVVARQGLAVETVNPGDPLHNQLNETLRSAA